MKNWSVRFYAVCVVDPMLDFILVARVINSDNLDFLGDIIIVPLSYVKC